MKNTKLKYKLNFKTMKKGLLTLLAASLVFVGCQNYDDQFDDLNAQISALKSQVDGLSALSGQVASLSGSISGMQ
jgi:outer membrane murein-binding lipoprotein Lpp